MSEDVQFNETKIVANPVSNSSPRLESGLISLVTRLSGGLIKNDTQAKYVIIALALAVFVLSLYLFAGSSGSSSAPSDLNFLPAE